MFESVPVPAALPHADYVSVAYFLLEYSNC